MSGKRSNSEKARQNADLCPELYLYFGTQFDTAKWEYQVICSQTAEKCSSRNDISRLQLKVILSALDDSKLGRNYTQN